MNLSLTKLLDLNLLKMLLFILITSGSIGLINSIITIKNHINIGTIDILNSNLWTSFLLGAVTPLIYCIIFYAFYLIWLRLIDFKVVDIKVLFKAALIGYIPAFIMSVINLMINIFFDFNVTGHILTYTIFMGVDLLNILGFIIGFYVLYRYYSIPKIVIYWGAGLYIIFLVVVTHLRF